MSTAFVFTLLLSLCKVASGQWRVIGPDEPVQALVGKDVMFTCSLSPETNAKFMEVRFFRNQFSAVVHLYRDGADQDYMQMAAYQGRTELVKDFIKDGHVSLKLKNISAFDVGLYGCRFSFSTYYEGATWELKVSEIGSTPLVSVVGYVDGGLQLHCNSSGWFPQPTVKWRGAQGQYLPSDIQVKTDISGLFAVETSLTVQHAGDISCSILNPEQNRELESRVWIGELFFQTSPWSVTSVLLGIILSVLCVGATGLILLCTRSQRELQKDIKNIEEELDQEEEQRHAEWREAQKYTVEVTLDPDTAHPQLVIIDQKHVTYLDTPQEVPKSEKRFSWPCVVASQGFQSGKHYWEVDVGHSQQWSLGVCRDDVDRSVESVHPDCGYWVFRLEPEHQYFIFNPNKTLLPLRVPLTRVGIFLDYEGGVISFFSINNHAHICTLKHQFEGLLRPYIQQEKFGEENVNPIAIFICSVPGRSEADLNPFST